MIILPIAKSPVCAEGNARAADFRFARKGSSMLATVRCPYFLKALAYSTPIGVLAGLVGLGGGEFRLPVLMHVIGFGARSAIPLNLVVSFVALAFALATRSHAVPLTDLAPHLPAIAGLLCGGVASAIYGARMVHRLSDARLVQFIALLLAGLGLLLLAEGIFSGGQSAWLPTNAALHFGVGALIGIGVGVVSSILGVAGGELLIPALMLVFGADIKTAGSASAMISLAVVAAGLWRHHAMGALALGRGERRIVASMCIGSTIGAIAGGLAIAYAPGDMLKLVLGCVLVAAAIKVVVTKRAEARNPRTADKRRDRR